MRGILADINVREHQRALMETWTSDAWRDLWDGLGLIVETFRTLGLSHNERDAIIWRICQREELVLMTANRSRRGPDFLEAAILSEYQPDILPVITIANTDRVVQDRLYAEKVAERLLDYLMRIDEVRGVGRIYVP
jgi:predicted nuclease of predicted toxin-antitoxin system